MVKVFKHSNTEFNSRIEYHKPASFGIRRFESYPAHQLKELKMGKAKRKPRPQPPRYFWLDADGCWFCKNLNGCGGCKVLKEYIATHQVKKRKELKK